MARRCMSIRPERVRRGSERVAADSFSDDRDEAQFQIRSPGELPEEKLPGALNGKRDGVYGGDGNHAAPFWSRPSVPLNYAESMGEVPQRVGNCAPPCVECRKGAFAHDAMALLFVADFLAQLLFQGLKKVEGDVGGLKVLGIGMGNVVDQGAKSLSLIHI